MSASIALRASRGSKPPFEVQSLSMSNSRRRQAQRLVALGTLSAGIAHDLNNILATMRANLSIAKSTLGPEHPAQRELEEIESSVTRASSLATRILNFSRPQRQAFRLIRIEAAVRESLQLLRATLPGRIEIVSKLAADLPAVLGDSQQIQQVLVNLGINSGQAMTEGQGVIRVCVERVCVRAEACPKSIGLSAGNYVCMRFSDTGCGMDAATCKRIFDPFFTTKRKRAGTGLGLSVVREIVMEHGGLITVQSKPGGGTEFSIHLPAAGEPDSIESSISGRLPFGMGQKILFLDDDAGFLDVATRVICKAGYQVTGYCDPMEALAGFSAAPESFDLVVADLTMPELNGLDVAQRVLAVRSDIPIIITAGYISPEDEALAAAYGVREVISKSATVEELCKAFGRVFGPNG
jgi:nitrogen-specific signal transduction histidine kinase/CheY-like chemotaxis protein